MVGVNGTVSLYLPLPLTPACPSGLDEALGPISFVLSASVVGLKTTPEPVWSGSGFGTILRTCLGCLADGCEYISFSVLEGINQQHKWSPLETMRVHNIRREVMFDWQSVTP